VKCLYCFFSRRKQKRKIEQPQKRGQERARERERETRKTRHGAEDRDERDGGIPLDALQLCHFTALPLRTVTCILEALPSYRGKMFAQNFKKKKLEIFFYKYNLFELWGGGEFIQILQRKFINCNRK